MTHGYSLRPNTNGRRGRKSNDNPENMNNTSPRSAGQGEADSLGESEGPPVKADETPAKPPPLSLVHKRPALSQGVKQRLETWHQRGITSSSTITTFIGPTRYQVEGPLETSEAIQEGRRRVEARHRVEAVRIQREQLERHYRQDLSGLHDRIAMLRRECFDEVARVRLEWQRTRAIERGEVAEADGEEEEEEGEGDGEDGEMECDEEEDQTEVDSVCAPTETWSVNDHDHDDERRPARTSQRWSHNHADTSSNVPPLGNTRRPILAPPPLQRLRRSPLRMAGPSSLGQPEGIEPGRRPSHGVQPLRRQPVELMPIAFFGRETGTTTSNDDGGTEEDQDSEMGEV
jgi:hypothetical protein